MKNQFDLMQKKEKFKLLLYITLTPIIVVLMIAISLITREKPLLRKESTDSYTQRELLDVINHTHTY